MPSLILVVDPDPEAHRATRSILEEAGYTCQTADTAIDALTYLKHGRAPALAILDLRIHDLPGTKLALRIHEQRPGTPVLFISGRAGDLVDPERLASLRWELLQKPVTRETLLPAIERLLSGTEATSSD
jgi:two-component system cell cycle sensor histidine kinase/response regulator CckA